jgi:hypothetical protein
MPPIRLEAHETKKIEMLDWAGPLGSNYQKGSVKLEFDSVSAGLGSVVMAVDETHSLGLNISARARTEFKSSQLEGIWKAPDDDARLTLVATNTTDHAVNASVVFSRPNGSVMKDLPLQLAAHQSRVLNLRELVVREDARFGAISIRHNGAPGAVMAQGFVTDTETGFSVNVPFLDPAASGDSRLDGAGIMIGASKDTPATQFSGRLLLRNVSAQAVTVNPVLQRGTERFELGAVNLAAGETREIIVAPQAAPGGVGAVGIEVTHTGARGSVVGHWFSIDDSGNLVVETPLRSVGPHTHVGGSNPWTLEGDNTAVT